MNDIVPFLLCLGVPVLIVVLYAFYWEQQQKAKRIARDNYINALEQLRQDPPNNELREAALDHGRRYARLAPKAFGEIQMMNDLNAIQQQYQTSLLEAQSTKGDVKTRLANLESLYNQEVITKEEYETRRNQILSEL